MIQLATDLDLMLRGADNLPHIYCPCDSGFECEGLATATTVRLLAKDRPGSMVVPEYYGPVISAHNMTPLGAIPVTKYVTARL